MTFEMMPGGTRKQLADIIAEFMDCEVKYRGAPTFAYEVGIFTITKHGNVIFDSSKIPGETVDGLAEVLLNKGYVISVAYEENEEAPTESEPTELENSESAASDCRLLSVQVSASKITPETLDNIRKLVASKEALIKKALGAESLPINVTDDDTIEFLWFPAELPVDDIAAYTTFIHKLIDTAKSQTRVNSTQKEVENEKFAFRCFLLKLGFIGDEYKAARKILLRNFEGSSAFKSGRKKSEDDENE